MHLVDHKREILSIGELSINRELNLSERKLMASGLARRIKEDNIHTIGEVVEDVDWFAGEGMYFHHWRQEVCVKCTALK